MIEDTSMTLVLKNLLDYVVIDYIGIVFVYRAVPLPVFLGRAWGISQSPGLGCHKAWYQSLTACRIPLAQMEAIGRES